ncbi:MAG TPA: hypothetical protein VFY29_03045 [Terriglobia bacterium]|nr:hypothetical protein [Terriglobia bacterium]
MNSDKNTPADEEFERASRLMEERARGLDQISEEALNYFRKRYSVCQVFVLDQIDVDFRAYVFFEKDKDVQESQRTGVQDEIAEFVLSALERAGRGKREDIRVAFEFDSDENVRRKFEGNYFLRLR